jgi:hypothetical protein
VTIAADSAYDLEDRLDSYKQAIPGIGDDVVDSYFGGKLLQNYRGRRDELFTGLGVEWDEDHRAVFDEVVDTQFSPEGGLQTPEEKPPEPVFRENMTDEEKKATVDAMLE